MSALFPEPAHEASVPQVPSPIFAPAWPKELLERGIIESHAQHAANCAQGCCQRWHLHFYRPMGLAAHEIPILLPVRHPLQSPEAMAKQAHAIGRNALASFLANCSPRN